MPGRTIAIGDIHGCGSALASVLAAIEPTSEDRIVTLGDYIDRGPDTHRVIDQLLGLQERGILIPLLGNHEIMMLVALDEPSELDFWLLNGGQETLDSYGGTLDDIPPSHLAFVRGCVRYHETDTHLFVHANYVPNLPLDRQPEFVLFWEHLSQHLPTRHCSGKIAIVGHTPQRNNQIFRRDYLICIDTNCCGRGCLTALDVDTGKIWQADANGTLLAG
jgi:serine/threonine protein phosphatase 1